MNEEVFLDQVTTVLKPIDLSELESICDEKNYEEILLATTKLADTQQLTKLTNADLIDLYKKLNTNVREKVTPHLTKHASHQLDTYLQAKRLVDVPHFLAHLPRIPADNIMNPPVEKAIVDVRGFSALQKDFVTLKGPVYGLQEHHGDLQLDIDAGLPPRIVQANPIYVSQIEDYRPL